jgi:uncharacterized membrane protein YhiD involved in acid resistance
MIFILVQSADGYDAKSVGIIIGIVLIPFVIIMAIVIIIVICLKKNWQRKFQRRRSSRKSSSSRETKSSTTRTIQRQEIKTTGKNLHRISSLQVHLQCYTQ